MLENPAADPHLHGSRPGIADGYEPLVYDVAFVDLADATNWDK